MTFIEFLTLPNFRKITIGKAALGHKENTTV